MKFANRIHVSTISNLITIQSVPLKYLFSFLNTIDTIVHTPKHMLKKNLKKKKEKKETQKKSQSKTTQKPPKKGWGG